jgi:SnoaL-like domain
MSTPSQEDRLQAIEDRLAIYTLIASHPPSADTAAANYTREVYTEDGVFDRGPKLEGAKGVDAIASFTLKPEHKVAIQGGLAHFAGLPLIDLRGRPSGRIAACRRPSPRLGRLCRHLPTRPPYRAPK